MTIKFDLVLEFGEIWGIFQFNLEFLNSGENNWNFLIILKKFEISTIFNGFLKIYNRCRCCQRTSRNLIIFSLGGVLKFEWLTNRWRYLDEFKKSEFFNRWRYNICNRDRFWERGKFHGKSSQTSHNSINPDKSHRTEIIENFLEYSRTNQDEPFNKIQLNN